MAAGYQNRGPCDWRTEFLHLIKFVASDRTRLNIIAFAPSHVKVFSRCDLLRKCGIYAANIL